MLVSMLGVAGLRKASDAAVTAYYIAGLVLPITAILIDFLLIMCMDLHGC